VILASVAAAISGTSLLLAMQAAPPEDERCKRKQSAACPVAEGSGEGFEISDGRSQGGAGGVDVLPVGGKNAMGVWTERRHVPTCTINTVQSFPDVCTAALETCPVEGEVQYWIFTREHDPSAGTSTEWERVTNPSTVCLAPDDPVLDPAVAIPAIIEREFKRVVVLKGVAEVSPRPDTLVNIPTRFSTAAPASYEIPLTLLGQSVVITAKAERFMWHFGDGVSAETSEPAGRVEHEYVSTGSRQAHVVIEWSGTYRIGGGPERTIAGTATTTGEPVQVEVKQARTELVRD
jgi:hypothetical protein